MTLDELIEEKMKDPEFAEEWNRLQNRWTTRFWKRHPRLWWLIHIRKVKD